MGEKAAVGILGAGAGLAIGYFLPQIIPKPKITISPNPATPGENITFTFTGFPPNASLVSMGGGTNGIGSGLYNLGATDEQGNLVVTGPVPSNLTSGNVVLYVAFDAQNPAIFATALYYAA